MFSTCLSYFLCLLTGCCCGYDVAMGDISEPSLIYLDQLETLITDDDLDPNYVSQYWENRNSDYSSTYEYEFPSQSGSSVN